MISKTIGFRGLAYFQTNPYLWGIHNGGPVQFASMFKWYSQSMAWWFWCLICSLIIGVDGVSVYHIGGFTYFAFLCVFHPTLPLSKLTFIDDGQSTICRFVDLQGKAINFHSDLSFLSQFLLMISQEVPCGSPGGFVDTSVKYSTGFSWPLHRLDIFNDIFYHRLDISIVVFLIYDDVCPIFRDICWVHPRLPDISQAAAQRSGRRGGDSSSRRKHLHQAGW